jgi:hypothetical protein
MNCLNLHDKTELLPTPMQVVNEITRNVSPLPGDIVKKIATLVNKPKLVAKCRQISRELDLIISEDNQQNRFYWEENMRRRWKDGEKGYYTDDLQIIDDLYQPIIRPDIPGLIHDYSVHYKIERAALKHLSLLDDNYDSLQLRGKDSASIYGKAIKYLNKSTNKASWLYLAGRHGMEKWHWLRGRKPASTDFLKWLEMAETKGHLNAAFHLAWWYLSTELKKAMPNTEDLTKGIQWLRTASNKNHRVAKRLLQRLESGERVSHDYLDTSNISAKSREFIEQTLGKRPHPDQQHEMGPPSKKLKINIK